MSRGRLVAVKRVLRLACTVPGHAGDLLLEKVELVPVQAELQTGSIAATTKAARAATGAASPASEASQVATARR